MPPESNHELVREKEGEKEIKRTSTGNAQSGDELGIFSSKRLREMRDERENKRVPHVRSEIGKSIANNEIEVLWLTSCDRLSTTVIKLRLPRSSLVYAKS